MATENLTTKNISEFQEGDSIYAVVYSQDRQFSTTYLCEFVKLVEGKKAVVKVISKEINKNSYDSLVANQEKITVSYKNLRLYGADKTEKHKYYRSLDSNGFFLMESDVVSEEDNEIPKEHESYGMIGFSRISSSHPRNLFGSPLQHKQTITLTIKGAEVDRSLNQDRYYGKGTEIQVEMSESQFTELITSFNRGDGVPCTITRNNGKMIETPPFKSYADKLSDEFKAKMHNVSAQFETSMKAIKMILDKKSINKGDREEIAKHIGKINSFLTSSLPFLADQFQEQTDEVVTKAKQEIFATINEAARKAGLEGSNLQDIIMIGSKNGEK